MAPPHREGTPADRTAENVSSRKRYRDDRDHEDERDHDRRRSRRESPPRERPRENGVRDERNRAGQKRKSDYAEDERSKRRRTMSRSPSPERRWTRGDVPPTGPRAQRGRGGRGGHDAQHVHQGRGGRRQGMPERGGKTDVEDVNQRPSAIWIPDIEVDEEDIELQQIKATMGFAGFKSTHNRQVPGNDKNYSVKKEKQTQYRQYMNRVGGFNRPLSPPKD